MKAYKRMDFIKLPQMTIYSRIGENSDELLYGLFCKMSGTEYQEDWVEQDLLAECGFPNDIKEGTEAIQYQLNLRDTFQDFSTDLYCGGRDGLFEEGDRFVVWDVQDIIKLRDYLNIALATTSP